VEALGDCFVNEILNERTHYGMDQIKGRTEANEKVWIFFSLLPVMLCKYPANAGSSKTEKSSLIRNKITEDDSSVSYTYTDQKQQNE
jgi:hypothetical protein